MYSLRRDRDNAGDSGPLCIALWEEDGELKSELWARPRVGVQIRVGALIARTYEAQDWWQTTEITEIISDTEEEVKFKTGNSTYTWRMI